MKMGVKYNHYDLERIKLAPLAYKRSFFTAMNLFEAQSNGEKLFEFMKACSDNFNLSLLEDLVSLLKKIKAGKRFLVCKNFMDLVPQEVITFIREIGSSAS